MSVSDANCVKMIHVVIIHLYTHNHTHTLQHSTNQLLLVTCIHMLQSVTHAHFSSTTVCMDLNCKNKGTAKDSIVPEDINIHVTIAYECVCLPRAAVAKIPIQTISFISAGEVGSGLRQALK